MCVCYCVSEVLSSKLPKIAVIDAAAQRRPRISTYSPETTIIALHFYPESMGPSAFV